ncbi:peptidylprolyl isomerase [Sulfodiicoccus acidiphilus]|uniref:Peptidyl-prolyl cis-trans isomerase n=1 Tax=Sulfodiicoccus acidiphilus TaxID=1670455 RepID=A0A348B6I1_9CREN|nr:peptidylprolyl isomerase [Sulfodiicoccus acidiphilus]BBD73783.1 peptidylprolyl isomerase [Sulfodiicoccus acidiphilus]GGU03735.1 peptidylprolyl isomerase [Sulfodiicoccus acidiphilus]
MFKDGDFIYIDYTLKIKDNGKVVDTTIEEEAKKNEIYESDKKYSPQLVILGEHRVIKGLEEGLYNLNVGDEVELEVPPEKGFGERDPGKVRVVPLSELRRQKVDPYPNMLLRMADGGYATVKSVSGGRVVLDLNHPYAGKSLVYKVKVVRAIEDKAEKVKALLARWFGLEAPEKFSLDLTENSLKVNVPLEYVLVEDLGLMMRMFAKDVLTFIGQEMVVEFTEKFDKSILSSK